MSAQPTPPLRGYHHLAMVIRDAGANVRFYRDLLRLRLVKKTVNVDIPETYHLFYGDELGTPGTVLSCFERPDMPAGRPGWGGGEHIALRVGSGAALAWWRGHLEREEVEVEGPFDDHSGPAIRLHDPDGLAVELVAPAGDDVPDGAPVFFVPAMAIGGIDHVALLATERETAVVYYQQLLGFDLLSERLNPLAPDRTDLVFGLGGPEPDGRLIVTLVERDAVGRAVNGPGQNHHVAFCVPDEAIELVWRERLESAGIPVSDVRDRQYFNSIYFRDPDGYLLEIATSNPGFTADEPLESLGTRLSLPPSHEHRRAELERALRPLDGDGA